MPITINGSGTITVTDGSGTTTIDTTTSVAAGKTPMVVLKGDDTTSSSSSLTLKKITTWNTSSERHFDPSGIYNSTNHRIIPTVAGYYWASFTIAQGTTDRTLPAILFSGASDLYYGLQNWDDANGINYLPDTITSIGSCDGVDDYIEFYSRCDGGNKTVLTLAAQVYLIRKT